MHGPVIGAEDEECQVAQKQHQSEGAQELGDHRTPQQKLDESKIAGDAEQKPDGCGHGQGQQWVDTGRLCRQQTSVHANHEKFPMGKVDDIHYAEDDGQAQGHQTQSHAEKNSGCDRAEKNVHGSLCCHACG